MLVEELFHFGECQLRFRGFRYLRLENVWLRCRETYVWRSETAKGEASAKHLIFNRVC